jgi:hypothetical protein
VAAAARDMVASDFSWERVTDRLEQILLESA